MSLRFIVGRAGTGKTEYCLAEIHRELLARPTGPGIIMLVPEQATFQMESALAGLPDLGGTIRAQVLSFRRLAFRVLQEVGGAERPHLRETGKRMILRSLLEQRKDQLKVFHRTARQPGFSDTLAHAITELKMYCIAPEQLLQGAAALDPGHALLRDKLTDLALLYGDLERQLATRLIDPDDYLNLLAERLPFSSICQGAEVWVDGFSGFTPQEYRVLEKLLTVSVRVNVALCCEPMVLGRPLEEHELFHSTHQTYDTLMGLAHRTNTRVEQPHIYDGDGRSRFKTRPALAHLERQYAIWPGRPYRGETDGLTLVAAHNLRAEVEAVARHIISLSREEGYRWREISVLVRDITRYSELVQKVFDDYDIPCFIDCKRPILHHPLVELVRSSLETVARGWTYDSVFRYLKTDLVPVPRAEVDQLENYVLAHGIRGSRWWDSRPWTYRRRYAIGDNAGEVEECEGINQIRYRAVEALAAFSRALEADTTVHSISTALYTLMVALGVKEQLEEWSRQAGEQGRLEQAREHAQVYNQVLSLLDEMVEALGELEVSVEEYARILEAGLENLHLGLIPPGLDQVFVGSLDRSRHPKVRANFLLGVNDGILPRRPSGEGLLTDRERELVLTAGVNVAPGVRRSLFDEQYLVYLGLTRASDYLWISYSLADEEGNGLNPSAVINGLKALFPQLRETTMPLEPAGVEEDIDFIVHPWASLSYLMVRLRETRAGLRLVPPWADVYNWMLTRHQVRALDVLSSLFHRNDEVGLQPGTRRNLYGDSLRAGVTQLEQFMSCPFGHFLRFGLEVKERDTARVRPLDLGQFFHAALKLFVEYLQEQGLDWREVTAEQCLELVDRAMDELIPQLQNDILMSSRRQQHFTRKLRDIILSSALALVEQTRCGSFRPIRLEVGFGRREEIPALQLTGPGGEEMQLVGRIDRVDAARSGNEVYLRVIDYKSGRARVELDDIYHGLRLQLLVYLDQVLSHARRLVGEPAIPGGIFFFNIQHPVIRTVGPMAREDIDRERIKAFRLNGLVLGEEELVRLMDGTVERDSRMIPVGMKKDGGFKAYSRIATRQQFLWLRRHLRQRLLEAGNRILAGEVDIRPYQKKNQKACDYCSFQAICQFDALSGNRYRTLPNLDNAEVWKRLEECFVAGGEEK